VLAQGNDDRIDGGRAHFAPGRSNITTTRNSRHSDGDGGNQAADAYTHERAYYSPSDVVHRVSPKPHTPAFHRPDTAPARAWTAAISAVCSNLIVCHGSFSRKLRARRSREERYRISSRRASGLSSSAWTKKCLLLTKQFRLMARPLVSLYQKNY